MALLWGAGACDALLTDPAPPPATVDVSFQIVPTAIGGSVQAFEKVRWAAVRFARPDGSFRDTVFVAIPVDGRIRIPVALELQERVDALGIVASLGLGPSPLFGGAGVVRIDPGQPTSAVIDVEPVPAAIVAESPLVFIPNVGESVDIASAALFATGDTVTGLEGTWLSEDPTTVEVTPTGTATAIQLGQTRLEVRAAMLADTVVVATSPVDTILLSPADTTLIVGETVQLTAVLQDASINALVGRIINWVSLDPAVASVDAMGLVRTTGLGATTIVVSSGTAVTSLSLTVVATPNDE
ncbi:MAG: hypothetical protein HKN72_00215 [Gemmatimonadetes bacterium]|nr:hypothetical protein [Gemmatimonadota bacterium]